jgi:cytochrome c
MMLQKALIRYSLFIFCISFFSCKEGITPGVVHEDSYDTNRLVKTQLGGNNLDEPLEIAVTGDGRVVIVERKGGVKMYVPSTGKIEHISSIPVFSGLEDGLLGVALDPQYEKNNFIYFYYSPAGDKPIQRVSRFVLKGEQLDLKAEKVLLEIPTQRKECCHSAGSLAFGPNGNLFIAAGDNTNPHNPGYYNSIDERKGREYWDAQRTAGNTNDFRGKILRIHPEPNGTYTIPEGNLFPKGTPKTKPEIYVMGCRNPYRINVDPQKGWLYWGDVGQNTIDDPKRGPISYDEWNLATEAGFFGWPYFAGPNAPYADFDFATEKIGPFFDPKKPVNNSVNNTGLENLPPAKSALIWYSYDESKLFPHLGTGGKSPIGGPVFYTDQYKDRINDTTRHLHAHFNNKVFIAEWMRDWINVLTVGEDGKLDSIETFMAGTIFHHPIDLSIGPDGVLYVLEYGTNWFAKNSDAGLYKIEYLRGNRAPIVKISADRTAGATPLTVKFSSKESFDPDSSDLRYQWYFEGQQPQSTDAGPSYTFSKPGLYKVRLVVEDKQGKTEQRTIDIRAGNDEPQISLNVDRGNKGFYWLNRPIEYSIDVNDREDGSLSGGQIPASAVKATVSYSTMGTDITMVAQSHETEMPAEPDFEPIRANDCKACHSMDQKSVGPSYLAISARYKKDSATINRLAEKIISGGSGEWGTDHAMSAHPQLVPQQAKEIAAYILSLKDDESLSRPLPLSGNIVPDKKKTLGEPGEYVIAVTYKDKNQQGAGSNEARKYFFIKNSRLRAANAEMRHDVLKTEEWLIQFNESGSWIGYKKADLTSIRSLNFELDASKIGGEFSIRLDKPDGKEIGHLKVEKTANNDSAKPVLQKMNAPISPVSGAHDLYIVYTPPPGENPADGKHLLVEWITFNL